MFDTMTLTKIVGGFCGAFLVFLLGGFAAELIYHEADSHDGEHQQAYTIDTGDDEDGGEEVVEVAFTEVYATADAVAGERLFRQCQACHKIEDGANGTGPHLFGVVGRGIGSVAGYNYSDAMGSAGGDWSPEALDGFLADPKSYTPGTKMTYKGLRDVEDRANLIAWLDSIGS